MFSLNFWKSKALSAVFCVFVAASLSICLTGCGGGGDDDPVFSEQPPDESTVWELMRQAYTYTYPLMLMNATIENGTNVAFPTNEQAPINQLAHATYITDASDFPREVNPTVEVLRSQAFIDLTDEPVVLEKPRADRFCNYEILDAYTNVVTNLGSGGDSDERVYMLTGPNYRGSVPANMIQISMPTSLAWLVVRTICSGDDDLENVWSLQNQMYIAPYSLYRSGGRAPEGVHNDLYNYIPKQHVFQMTCEEYFNLANELMLTNPPTAADESLMRQLARINIGPGKKFKTDILGENGLRYYETLKTELKGTWLSSGQQYLYTNNNWPFYSRDLGKYQTDYNYRACIADNDWGVPPNSVAIFTKRTKDDDGNILSGAQNYKLHFTNFRYQKTPATPPVRDDGFWVIAVYDTNGYLVENDINRYVVTSHDEFDINEDGSLDIFLQNKELLATPTVDPNAIDASSIRAAADPANTASGTPTASPTASANWLPTGTGNFTVQMRIYLPKADTINGGYRYPSIERADKDKEKAK